MTARSLLAVALLLLPAPLAAQEEGIPVGTPAPAVVVNDLEGKAVNLGDYIGRKPVLLEFWATWCSVCDDLLPRVRAAHKAYGDQVEFFGVNVTVNQTPERVRRWVEKHQPPYRTLYDEQGASTRAYQAPLTSYIVIVDRKGTVAYTGTGAEQDLEAALRKVVK
jgi:thiol-disulfide isomerase/thioredoxin